MFPMFLFYLKTLSSMMSIEWQQLVLSVLIYSFIVVKLILIELT